MKLSSMILALAPFAAAFPTQDSRVLHKKEKDLSNGAVLDVEIQTPPEGSNVPLDVNVPIGVQGTASVGVGDPDVAYIYVIDTSGSTGNWDGACGSVLDCVQEFFLDLHESAISDGSAELVGVINFDWDPTWTGLLAPNSTEVEDAINSGFSGGDTICAPALIKARELAVSPNNTAGTTVVVFAGDGLCNDLDDDVRAAADDLAATGAIIHTVAVGDDVDCAVSQGDQNNFLDIPRNGGSCTSVPDPHTLPHIVDELIGTTLVSIDIFVDGFNYTATATGLNTDLFSMSLPQDGAVSVDFNMTVVGLNAGDHEICVRATGEDSLGWRDDIEDCHEVFVQEPPTMSPTVAPTKWPTWEPTMAPTLPPPPTDDGLQGWEIFLIVASALIGASLVVYSVSAFFCGSSGSVAGKVATPKDLEFEEAGDEGNKQAGTYEGPTVKPIV